MCHETSIPIHIHHKTKEVGKFKNKILQAIHEQVLQHNRESWVWWFCAVTLCLWKESKCFTSLLITLVIHKNTMAVKWSYGGLKIFSIVFEQWNSSLMEQNPIFKNILNCKPIIPVLKRSKQEDCSWVQGHPGIDSEFQANQICRVRPCLKQTKMANNNSTWQTVYNLMLQQKDRIQTGILAPISTTDIITPWK